jgi:hypothetical protein
MVSERASQQAFLGVSALLFAVRMTNPRSLALDLARRIA